MKKKAQTKKFPIESNESRIFAIRLWNLHCLCLNNRIRLFQWSNFYHRERGRERENGIIFLINLWIYFALFSLCVFVFCHYLSMMISIHSFIESRIESIKTESRKKTNDSSSVPWPFSFSLSLTLANLIVFGFVSVPREIRIDTHRAKQNLSIVLFQTIRSESMMIGWMMENSCNELDSKLKKLNGTDPFRSSPCFVAFWWRDKIIWAKESPGSFQWLLSIKCFVRNHFTLETVWSRTIVLGFVKNNTQPLDD